MCQQCLSSTLPKARDFSKEIAAEIAMKETQLGAPLTIEQLRAFKRRRWAEFRQRERDMLYQLWARVDRLEQTERINKHATEAQERREINRDVRKTITRALIFILAVVSIQVGVFFFSR